MRWPRTGWAERAIRASVGLLFPPRCVACGEECDAVNNGPLFCATCNVGLGISRRLSCPKCASFRADVDLQGGDCGDCRSRKLLFAAARAVAPYDGILRDAVLMAKHAANDPLATALGQRLAEVIAQSPYPQPPDVVVSVPMHWLERIKRRNNHASTLAESVARSLGLTYLSHSLLCRRPMKRQATLKPHERRKNVRGAFIALRRRAVAGKRVLLVDDVMTTGATAHEASRRILAAGAAAIYVATVARSSSDF